MEMKKHSSWIFRLAPPQPSLPTESSAGRRSWTAGPTRQTWRWSAAGKTGCWLCKSGSCRIQTCFFFFGWEDVCPLLFVSSLVNSSACLYPWHIKAETCETSTCDGGKKKSIARSSSRRLTCVEVRTHRGGGPQQTQPWAVWTDSVIQTVAGALLIQNAL